MLNAEFEMTEDESIQFEKDYERFSIIQKENNFKTEWDLFEVKDINELSPYEADYLTDGYHNVEIILPNGKLTWLELWKYTNMLYETTGDIEHMFIESFKVIEINGKKELQVFLGS